MPRVCLVVDLAAVFFGCQQSCFGKLVQLLPDRVRRGLEFFGQFPQVGLRFRVEEEPDQEFDPGF